jgi:hypothetical protein
MLLRHLSSPSLGLLLLLLLLSLLSYALKHLLCLHQSLGSSWLWPLPRHQRSDYHSEIWELDTSETIICTAFKSSFLLPDVRLHFLKE